MSSGQMNPCSKPYPIADSEGLASETQIVISLYIDTCVKIPLGVMVWDFLMKSKEVSQISL